MNEVTENSPPPLVSCRDVVVEFPRGGSSVTVLDGVSLDIQHGEFVCLVGPSGCGKSTLLNVIAGIQARSSGSVAIGEEAVTGLRTDLGYMRQQASLFPWRTVRQNVAYGLELERRPDEEVKAIVNSLIERVGLSESADQYPHQLSGGMQQRTSLARTLAVERKMLLMDEPFAALDAQTRAILEKDLLQLRDERGISVLFVTHDLAEAIALGDRVVVLAHGSGRIRGEFEIDLPHPRDPMDIRVNPRFNDLYQEIWALLRQEYSRTSEAGGS